MSLLLCFSGQIGSGKSSVSEAVAEVLGWRCTGFGGFLRAYIARIGGDPTSREALQELGQQRVDSDPEAFCRDVLESGGFRPGDDLVIDGVRHVDIFCILRQQAVPSSSRLIFLQASDAACIARVRTRSDHADLGRATGHRVEAQLRDALPEQADAVIDADCAFDEVVGNCLAAARSWR
jgi:dephospho-CoA kinase